MATLRFPLIDPNMLAALKSHFPNKPIKRTDTESDLKWKGGEQSVIDFLQRKHNEQQERSY